MWALNSIRVEIRVDIGVYSDVTEVDHTKAQLGSGKYPKK